MTTIDENTIIGGDENDEITISFPRSSGYTAAFVFGNGGDDTMRSQSQLYLHAELHGGEGDDDIGSSSDLTDTLFGDAGNDYIYQGVEDIGYGGDGDDTFSIFNWGVASTGAVRGGAGDDLFVLDGVSELRIDGGKGNDSVVLKDAGSRQRLTGIETIGIIKSTYLEGSTLDGIEHVSAYAYIKGQYVPHAAHIRLEFLSPVELDGSIFDKNVHGQIFGSKRDDVFDFSLAATNARLSGNYGNDLLIGGDGDNYLDGGGGNDTLIGGGGDDIIDTGMGGGKGNVIDAGSGNDKIFLNEQHNSVEGGNDDDLIIGPMHGGHVSGSYIGGGGDDRFEFNGISGHDTTIIGGAGHDVLVHTGELSAACKIDVDELDTNGIYTSPAILNNFKNIEITARGSFNVSLTASGHVDFHNLHGLDRVNSVVVSASRDNQTMDLSKMPDWVQCSVNMGGGNDRITGSASKDAIYGDQGNDILAGGKGDDFINGGAGTDVLIGSEGRDRFSGGAGRDVYVFRDGIAGSAIISNFDHVGRNSDIIDLSAVKSIHDVKDLVHHVDVLPDAIIIRLGEYQIKLEHIYVEDLDGVLFYL